MFGHVNWPRSRTGIDIVHAAYSDLERIEWTSVVGKTTTERLHDTMGEQMVHDKTARCATVLIYI